jgi:hypothetical protein
LLVWGCIPHRAAPGAAIHSKKAKDRPDANVARLVTRQLIDDYADWAREFDVEPAVA